MIGRVEKEVDMLERHLTVFSLVRESQPIGIVKLADRTGYPNHKIRYSLRVLQEEGIVEPTDRGAVTTEREGAFVAEFGDRIGDVIERLERVDADGRAGTGG